MHRTRRHTLLAIAGCTRGPALRDAPTDAPADGTTGGGSSTDAGGTGTGTTDGQPATDTTDWKAKHDALLKDSRKWEDRAKANIDAATKFGEVGATIKKLFGLDQPTPEQLTEHLTLARTEAEEADVRAAATEVENLVLRTAYRLGVDADRLLDSRTFEGAVDAIEASTEVDFKAKLEALIKTYLQRDPGLKAGGAAGGGRMGAVSGGSGGGTAGRPTSVRDAYARTLNT